MGETIRFKNKDTETTIRFDVNKPLVLVFGKNGSGKTTLSREFSDKDLVFNTDFIYKNIYIESNSETKIDANTKESFSSLWVGEAIVNLKKELNDLKQKKDSIADALNNLTNTINMLMNRNAIPLFPYADFVKNIKTEEYKKPDNVPDGEIIEKHTSSISLKSDVLNDDDLKSKITRYRNETAVKMLNNRLSSCLLLKQLFLDKKKDEKNNIIRMIADYNNSIEELT